MIIIYRFLFNINTYSQQRTSDAVFIPNESIVVSVGWDRKMLFFDTRTGDLIRETNEAHPNNVLFSFLFCTIMNLIVLAYRLNPYHVPRMGNYLLLEMTGRCVNGI